jgi:hypothetical protein
LPTNRSATFDWDRLTGGGYHGGGVGGGVPADAVLTPAEKAEKDAEYDDIKQRSLTPPPQSPNESNKDYQLRLANYFNQLADDDRRFDQKWQKLDPRPNHSQKISEIKTRANKAQTSYEGILRHEENIRRGQEHEHEKQRNDRDDTCNFKKFKAKDVAIELMRCIDLP